MESVAPPLFNPLRECRRNSLFPVLRPILPLPHSSRHGPDQTATQSSIPSPPDTPPKPSIFASGSTAGALSITTWSPALVSQVDASKKQKRRRRSLPFSYSVMITQAILSSNTHQMTLRDIYLWISSRYPDLYADNETGWQNTIRHNLSLNRMFKKVPRQESGLPGKGGYWTIEFEHFDYEAFRQKASVEIGAGGEKYVSPAYTTLPLTQRALLSEMQYSSSSSPSDASCSTDSMASSPPGSVRDYLSSPGKNMDRHSETIVVHRYYAANSRPASMNIQNLLN